MNSYLPCRPFIHASVADFAFSWGFEQTVQLGELVVNTNEQLELLFDHTHALIVVWLSQQKIPYNAATFKAVFIDLKTPWFNFLVSMGIRVSLGGGLGTLEEWLEDLIYNKAKPWNYKHSQTFKFV